VNILRTRSISRLRFKTVILNTAILSAALAGSAGAQSSVPFTGSWSVAPQAGTLSTAFNQETLRQTLHTSMGGSAVRIRISNLFGTQPLSIDDVHLAQASGTTSTTLSGTDHQLTFSGQTTVTIAAGAEVVSDTLNVTIAPLADYAVSMYFPTPTMTSNVTYHQMGGQSSYWAAGDVSSSLDLTLDGEGTSDYFLTNLDVQNSAAAGAVVTLGASITDFINSSFNANTRWTNDLAVRLTNAGLSVGVVNQGISGNQLLQNGAGLSAENRFAHDVLSQANVHWVIFSDDPINDLLSNNPPPTATALITGIQQLISQAHAKGIKFYCSTLTPYAGYAGWNSSQEPIREQVNTFVRGAGSGCDGVIDQDTAVHDPANPTFFRASFNVNSNGTAGDGLHPNDTGMQAIANTVNLGLFTTTGVPPITAPTQSGELLSGQGLTPDHPLYSADGRFDLYLQDDGNLVIYEGSTPLWAAGVVGVKPSEVIFQPDGNLVEYDTAGKVLWQSNSAGRLGQTLFMQNDGNLVIYDGSSPSKPVWASGSCCH
jgi:lysophospholipase L1-like esterase